VDAGELLRAPLGDLCAEARLLRAQGHGTLVTYSPKVFIPLTKLCRDVCGYCTFARPPRRGQRAFLTEREVLRIARAGAKAGCHEALFTLGDKPELRYRVAREELAELGCESTLEYLRRTARVVLDETGLLPHLNPGIMTAADLGALRPVSVSMGLMLETVSERLSRKGGPHYGSPDKDPAARLATIEAAGRARVPFTTGILIGIGETRAERIDALLAIRDLGDRHGHVQEVIVQNFRAKPGTRMSSDPEPSLEEMLWTVAVARILLGPRWNLQAPPNLSYADFPRLLDAGINDWGGVSPVTIDHVNPEAPWPQLAALERATESRGLRLGPRLPIYPEYVAELERWADPAVAPFVLRRSDADGMGRENGWAPGLDIEAPGVASSNGRVVDPRVAASLERSRAGAELEEEDVVALLRARGSDVGTVCRAADELRREVCGDEVTYVVTRNINYTNVCYFRCGFCAFSKGKLAKNLRGRPYLVPLEEILRRSREARDRGAVEVCLQGGIHPAFSGDYYVDMCRAIKAELPDLHVHAFSALEVWQGAATLGVELGAYLLQLREAGLASLPGTAAEVLDDEVRRLICPDKVTTAQWLEVHDTAHRVGLRSTSTVMFGHVDAPRHLARHLLRLREQQRRSRGFTELVPLPFVHMEAPIYLKGRARAGPTFREAVLLHAAARLALHPWITNIQASWVKLGIDGAQAVLQAGANDLGGTLMNESISRAAGAGHGQEMPPERMESAIRAIGRKPRQRTTFYGEVDAESRARSFGAPPLEEPRNPSVNDAGLRAPPRLVRPGLLGSKRQRTTPGKPLPANLP
jgi:FO synthase